MSYDHVIYDKRGHVAYVTLNRPERMNALDAHSHAELIEIFDDFESDDNAWVAVITGAGDRAFCAGNDLKATAQASANGERRVGLERGDVSVGAQHRREALAAPAAEDAAPLYRLIAESIPHMVWVARADGGPRRAGRVHLRHLAAADPALDAAEWRLADRGGGAALADAAGGGFDLPSEKRSRSASGRGPSGAGGSRVRIHSGWRRWRRRCPSSRGRSPSSPSA